MSVNFEYILDKIDKAQFSNSPFKHLYIEELFSSKDFDAIINSPEIKTNECGNDQELFDQLFKKGYDVIKFPGCIGDVDYYMDWHAEKYDSEKKLINNAACEGFGMTLRLTRPQSDILSHLKDFIESEKFLSVIAKKFQVNLGDCEADNGIQKYLDGYEISPHADIRRKALTYMVNINSAPNSFDLDHHTRYLELKGEYKYLESFWRYNTNIERAWIPWNWCNVKFQQKNNNSMVIFAPSNDTLHAVKADYNHLIGQRTQLYGNLWSKHAHKCEPSEWQDLDIVNGIRYTNANAVVRDEEFRMLQRGDRNSETVHDIKHRS